MGVSNEGLSILDTCICQNNLLKKLLPVWSETVTRMKRREVKKQKVGDDLRFIVLELLLEVSTLPSLVVINILKGGI